MGATAETWDAETGSFTYDANGNIATAPAPYAITAVSYNAQNLPVSLTSNGQTTTYRYDDAGQRITKQVGAGNTEVYLRDGATTLAVFTVNGAGTPVSWYFNVFAGDRVVGRQPNVGNRRHYHFDLLGSTRAVVESATVVESYDFEPWGLLMPGRTLGAGTKDGFTGKERDGESGLDYFGARLYMPALGRWVGVDPLADKFPNFSPYTYALNDPVRLIDPTGLQAEEPCTDRNAAGRVSSACRAQNAVAQQQAKAQARANQKAKGGFKKLLETIVEYASDPVFVVTYYSMSQLQSAAQSGVDLTVELAGDVPAPDFPYDEMAVVGVISGGSRGFSSFSAFKRVIGSAGPNREWHHIVEQYQVGRFGAERTHHTSNLIAIPKGIHERISGYYSSKTDFTWVGGKHLTVRKWLHGKSYEEQHAFGLELLRTFMTQTNQAKVTK